MESMRRESSLREVDLRCAIVRIQDSEIERSCHRAEKLQEIQLDRAGAEEIASKIVTSKCRNPLRPPDGVIGAIKLDRDGNVERGGERRVGISLLQLSKRCHGDGWRR
ncbi:hypothetical protein TorRG33x02_290930 [Trema orientale]|uniref:Uncharacterized protein n=1 Tax=Trema orientale TaxID=63057 RepID=A0A2P5CBX4_TREOI|nr:hypothetical protein TorRG33x02_290930 [Trema orientale]